MPTYNFSTYNSLIYDIQDEVNSIEFRAMVSPESIKGFILQGCQRIAAMFPIPQRTDLRLIYGQSQYFFSDTTTPVTGTGTVGCSNLDVTGTTSAGTGTLASSASDITGTSTLFLSELTVGKMIIVGTQLKMVNSITSNTVCTIEGSFTTNLTASSFTISSTLFTKEINTGSSIIIGGVTRIVNAITDAYNLTVTLPFTASQSAQTFTVDTMVTEIPTKLYNLFEISRLEGIVDRPVVIVSNQDFQRRKQFEFVSIAYSSYNQPYIATVWINNAGRKYLEFYPTVQTDKTITIYGYIQVNPRTYASDALTANIPLTQEYEPAIKEYAKYRIFKKIKDNEQAQEAIILFNQYVSSLVREMPTKARMEVSE